MVYLFCAIIKCLQNSFVSVYVEKNYLLHLNPPTEPNFVRALSSLKIAPYAQWQKGFGHRTFV